MSNQIILDSLEKEALIADMYEVLQECVDEGEDMHEWLVSTYGPELQEYIDEAIKTFVYVDWQ